MMDIEQKAKAYDEALERYKAKQKYESEEVRKFVEYLFPVLTESEDEKIRKEIISAIKEDWPGHEDWIAWLEKQGEHKSYVSETMNEKGDFDDGFTRMIEKEQKPKLTVKASFKKGDWIVFNGLTLYIKEVVKWYYRTISIDGIPNSYDWDIDNVARLWTIKDAKAGDVLATDDWVFIFKKINSNGKPVCHCHYDIELGFRVDNTNSYIATGSKIYPATKEQRDLLFQKMKEAGYEWNADKKELKKIEQKHTPKHKVGDTIYYNSFGEVKSMVVANVVTDSAADNTDNPMYEDKECNAVFEKDLIEQKTAWSEEDVNRIGSIMSTLGHDVYRDEKYKDIVDTHKHDIAWLDNLYQTGCCNNNSEWSEEIRQEYERKYNEGKAIGIELGKDEANKQMLKWSEEDKEIINNIGEYLNCYGNYIAVMNEEKAAKIYKSADWLKYLKGRVLPQPKQEWSEEDKVMLESIIADFCGRRLPTESQESWLKSLKDRVQPQQTEWSEEDERMLENIIKHFIRQLDNSQSTSPVFKDFSKKLDWLRSLRPQNNVTDEELAQAKKDAYNDALDKIEYHSGEPTFDDGWSAALKFVRQKQWKPSDEQMNALNDVISSRDIKYDVLSGLWKDLKEL